MELKKRRAGCDPQGATRSRRRTSMKKVEAIIAPPKLDAVRDALMARGFAGLSVSEVAGHGHEPDRVSYYRGAPYDIDFHPKLKLEIVVRDEDAIPTAYVISDAARTGRVGDGKIMILAVEDAVRVRTGEHGLAAIFDHEAEPPVERRWAAVG
jgi:nitrogen regulatory protein PII